MTALPPSRLFDFATLSVKEGYKLLIGSIVPRPIAWVTSIDQEGKVNAAPFSFFNCVSDDPPLVVVSIDSRGDAAVTAKDTAWNIHLTQEFTINIVSNRLVEAMNICAIPFAAGIEELTQAGLTIAPGVKVKTPRIAEAPAALECKRYMTLEVGNGRSIVLGQVVAAHFHDDVVNDRLHVDPARLDAVGRMGGAGYATTRDYFELDRLTVEDHEAGKKARRRS